MQKVSTSVLNFALFFSNHSGYFKFCIESFLYRVLLSVDKFVSTTEAQKVSKKSVISIQCQEPITWSVQLLYRAYVAAFSQKWAPDNVYSLDAHLSINEKSILQQLQTAQLRFSAGIPNY